MTATVYKAFAAAYASGAERTFSERMARFALSEATSRTNTCKSVLDVACGIGAACELFAGAGLRTTGLDSSDEMLREARKAAATSGLPITYLRQDMRLVDVPSTVDLVTCMYDSLNFMLTDADLRLAFCSARGALRSGGLYVFDMYTVHGLADVWGSADEVHTVHDAHFVATRTHWDSVALTNTKTLWGFDRSGDGWQRWEERHTVRAYTDGDIQTALSAAGFDVHGALDWDSPDNSAALGASTTRAVYLAKAK